MHKQGDSLARKPNLEYFVGSSQSDGLWFLGRNKYCGCNYDFQMRMRTSGRLIKMFVEWHKVEVFYLPLRDRPQCMV